MLKRCIDIGISGIIILILMPFIVLLFMLIILGKKEQILFTQVRIGKDNKPFTLIKLKTMNDWVDATGKRLPDAERLTDWGRFLRKTSLDELPQLWNILRGDMSWVGPRPLLPQYLPLYSKRQIRRHEVKPGITGWAQVNGRNTISWQDKFELDLYYVENHSLFFDIKILFLTVFKVLKKADINADTSTTMKPFTGNSRKDMVQDS
jgi:lipopolysaccharide/colanic/teichoic acid biosynthesis glycosyltransferase